MKKALCVGINDYPDNILYGCVNDATAVSTILQSNGDGSPNFDIRLETTIRDKSELKSQIIKLFSGEPDIALLYFSGHGFIDAIGGYLVTPDFKENDVGVSMDEILKLANDSKAKNRVIILDCCHSGKMGHPAVLPTATLINTGMTILTVSRDVETAVEVNGHGIFTNLLLEALKGGAADLGGDITPGSIYSFIDQALGPWDQRPVFKTNITEFVSLREIQPTIPKEDLRKIIEYFPTPHVELKLDPSFEFTNKPDVEHKIVEPYADPINVDTFKILQKLASVSLVKPIDEEHMYFAAMNSKSCKLTALGYHYWRLVKDKKF